jgi:hypothetical protein
MGTLSALGLTWEKTTITHEASATETEFAAVFPFTNEGDQTVTIESVRSSCGCTVPELEKREYGPGESGEITAVFTFGTRTGAQRKTVSVITNEPDIDRQNLVLEVNIPVLIEVRPFFVFWRKGDDVSTKSIEVQVVDPELIKPVSVESSSENFEATLRPDEKDAATWHVDITPGTTETSGNTHLLLKTDFPEENPRIVRVYAGIR